jgi:hypothetical protein
MQQHAKNLMEGMGLVLENGLNGRGQKYAYFITISDVDVHADNPSMFVTNLNAAGVRMMLGALLKNLDKATQHEEIARATAHRTKQ